MGLISKTQFLFYCLLLYVPIFLQASVYSSITDVIDRYKRPTTILILDDSDQLALSLAKQYQDNVFVLLNQKKIVSTDFLHNLIHLMHNSDIPTLIHLGESEHFDIVIVRSHHSPFNAFYINALYNLGEEVIVDVQLNSEKAMLHHFLRKGFLVIEDTLIYKLFYNKHAKNFLLRTQWLEPTSEDNYVREIVSTYTEKKMKKNIGSVPIISDWLPGINLMTFKMLNGQIPSINLLKSEIIRLFDIPHFDWMPNNMIVQGGVLVLIDFGDTAAQPKTVHTQRMLDLMLAFVEEKKTALIPMRYQDILLYCRYEIHPEFKKTLFLGLIRKYFKIFNS